MYQLFLTFLLVGLMAGCTAPDCPQCAKCPDPPEITAPDLPQPDSVHPIDKVVGYYHPKNKMIYIQPGHEIPVLQALGARKNEAGGFSMNAQTYEGESIPVEVEVTSVRVPALMIGANNQGENGEVPGRILVDAECKKPKRGPYLTPCAKESSDDGNYVRIQYLAPAQCVDGTGYCVQLDGVASGYFLFFQDKECKVATGARPIFGFATACLEK